MATRIIVHDTSNGQQLSRDVAEIFDTILVSASSPTEGMVAISPGSGAWIRKYGFHAADGATSLGGFGCRGSNDTLKHLWVGVDNDTGPLYVEAEAPYRVSVNTSSFSHALRVAGTARIDGATEVVSHLTLYANLVVGTNALYVHAATNNVMIGASNPGAGDGTWCLTMKEGVAPTATSANTFVQFCDQVGSITGAPHWRCSDGNTMKLYRHAAMTTEDTGTSNSGDATTDGVIDNLRTRIGELEAILINLGVLA